MAFRSTLALALLLCASLAACGDDGRPTDTGAPDTGPADSGMGDGAPTDTGSADTGSSDGGSTDSGSPDGSPDAAPDGGTSDLVVTEASVFAWANCMPVVGPDPLNLNLELSYDNSAGAAEATATITSARLTFDDTATSMTEIGFDVEMVTVAAGATVMQAHRKTDSMPVLDACSICSAERMVTYEVMIDTGGATTTISGTTAFGCTF